MHIFTPDTKCDFIGCDVPNISVEKFASNACHAIRTQFAEREHVSRLFEWVIDTQKTVTISRPFVYAAPEYGKLADWVCDGSGALLATACRTEVSNSDGTVRLNNQHSRGLTVGHAAHAVDFNRRPILSRQNVLALFRIPTASTNRAAEPHEYQRSGFDDGEPFAVVQGYGKLLKMDFHDSTCDNNFRTDEQIDCPIRCNRYLDRTLQV